MKLDVDNLRSGYGDLIILHGLSLKVESGETVAILGHNGVGKTTLMRTIVGLLRPVSGEIRAAGHVISGLPPHTIAGMGIAYIPQEAALFADLSVLENLQVAFPGPRSAFQEACDRVVDYFPFLRERYHQRAGTLSGGQQKMLLLARAALPSPRLILADEVTEGVQPSQIRRMGEVIAQLKGVGETTLVLVEQHLEFALDIADRYAIMKQGRIAAEGAIGQETRAVVESELTI